MFTDETLAACATAWAFSKNQVAVIVSYDRDMEIIMSQMTDNLLFSLCIDQNRKPNFTLFDEYRIKLDNWRETIGCFGAAEQLAPPEVIAEYPHLIEETRSKRRVIVVNPRRKAFFFYDFPSDFVDLFLDLESDAT